MHQSKHCQALLLPCQPQPGLSALQEETETVARAGRQVGMWQEQVGRLTGGNNRWPGWQVARTGGKVGRCPGGQVARTCGQVGRWPEKVARLAGWQVCVKVFGTLG